MRSSLFLQDCLVQSGGRRCNLQDGRAEQDLRVLKLTTSIGIRDEGVSLTLDLSRDCGCNLAVGVGSWDTDGIQSADKGDEGTFGDIARDREHLHGVCCLGLWGHGVELLEGCKWESGVALGTGGDEVGGEGEDAIWADGGAGDVCRGDFL